LVYHGVFSGCGICDEAKAELEPNILSGIDPKRNGSRESSDMTSGVSGEMNNENYHSLVSPYQERIAGQEIGVRS